MMRAGSGRLAAVRDRLTLALVVPATLGVGLLMGVPSKSSNELSRLQEQYESDQASIRAMRDAGGISAEELERGLEQVRGAREEIRRLFPGRISSVEAFSLLRLSTEGAGFEVRTVELTDSTDTGLTTDVETLVMQKARIAGTANPLVCTETVEGLRALGVPTCVLSFSLSRAKATAREFDTALEVGLFHHAPPRPRSVEESETNTIPLPGGDEEIP